MEREIISVVCDQRILMYMCECVCVCVSSGAWEAVHSLYYFNNMNLNSLPVQVSFRPLKLAKNSNSAIKQSIFRPLL